MLSGYITIHWWWQKALYRCGLSQAYLRYHSKLQRPSKTLEVQKDRIACGAAGLQAVKDTKTGRLTGSPYAVHSMIHKEASAPLLCESKVLDSSVPSQENSLGRKIVPMHFNICTLLGLCPRDGWNIYFMGSGKGHTCLNTNFRFIVWPFTAKNCRLLGETSASSSSPHCITLV